MLRIMASIKTNQKLTSMMKKTITKARKDHRTPNRVKGASAGLSSVQK